MTTTPEPGAELITRGRTITESDLVSFSSLTGDWHPQHGDAQWAAGSRFGERVAHGMLVMSYAVGLMPFDPERVVALRGLDAVTFKRPVRIGDTIRVRSRVESARRLDDHHELVSFNWRVVNQHDEVVARARVDALWKVEPPVAGNGSVDGTSDGEAEEAEAEGNLVLL
jgi:3-hydroxybutyryl-CoA dehydratase